MDMITYLEGFLQNDDTKILYILCMILAANTVDFSLGWFIAKFNPDVKFSSSRAVFGIARKIVLYILLIMFIPFSLLLPDTLGLSALYVLYIGYLVTEMFSILNHLGITTDTKDGIFYEFMSKVFHSSNLDKDK